MISAIIHYEITGLRDYGMLLGGALTIIHYEITGLRGASGEALTIIHYGITGLRDASGGARGRNSITRLRDYGITGCLWGWGGMWGHVADASRWARVS